MKPKIKIPSPHTVPFEPLVASLSKVPQDYRELAARDAAIFVAGFRSGLEHQTAHTPAPRQTASA